jgi:5-methyltetrahydropteroyltriglutamate--homocysteine methyltransferase
VGLATEPIGSIPRPQRLLDGIAAHEEGQTSQAELDALYEDAVRETVASFEHTGSPVVTDGEQRKPSFATYPIAGLEALAPDGVVIPFADGHTRQLPLLTAGPFRYGTYAGAYLEAARPHAHVPMKQAVIAASALSLLYPESGIDGYSQEAFLDDLVAEAEADIRSCLAAGAHAVQIDFTEGRLAVKLDPSKAVLRSFVELNNRVLARFSPAERERLGVHTCPGGDQDSTHSADIDYAELLPSLFELQVTNFYVQLASEQDRERVLDIIAGHLKPGQMVFVGVTDPIDPRVETPEEVCGRVLEAAAHIPVAQLGTTDDCGFAPFGDDVSTARETAFAKIAARVTGTEIASRELGVSSG